MGLILPENMAKMTEIGRDVKVGKLKLEASKGAVPLARTRPSARDLGVAVGAVSYTHLYIRLVCLKSDAPGLRFWKALGFAEEGRLPWEGTRWVIEIVQTLSKQL